MFSLRVGDLGVAIALVFVVGACAPGPARGTPALSRDDEQVPLGVMTAREVAQIVSIEQATAAADVVGRFVVREVVEGRDKQLVTYSVTLGTVELLAGDPPPSPFTIATDEVYWSPDLVGTNRDWLRIGDEVLLMLVRRSDTGILRPLSSQAIFRIDGRVALGVWEGPVASQYDGRPLADLRDAILGAP